MPYGKKRFATKRYSKRRYSNTRVLAKKALRVAKKAYRLPEIKYHQLSTNPTSETGVGSITCLTNINQGTSDNQRIGDMIKPTSVKYRCTVNLTSPATNTLLRMIIFRWISEEPTNAADVLEAVTVQSYKSQNLRYQSEILKDTVIRINSVDRPELFLTGSIKLRNPIMFNATGNSNRNAIWVLFVSDEVLAQQPTIAWNSRVYFRDP